MSPGEVMKYFLFTLAFGLCLAFPAAAQERQAVSKVPPQYPAAAKQLRVSGEVKIEAQIDADGTVTSAKPVSGNPLLTKAAADAVSKWKFKPGEKTTTVVKVNFAL
jgi:protein TonB